MNEQTDKQVWLNTLLSTEQAEEFDQIQTFYGINTRSDVVRMLIRQEHHRITNQHHMSIPAEAQS